MTKITIRDLNEGILAFDLRDLLRTLAPRSLAATWTISTPDESGFEATGAGGMRLEKLAESSSAIGGDELLALADETVQVIWGNFVGSLPQNPREAWITIRAVDSSFYEVETSDHASIAQVVSHFDNVRFAEDER